MTLKPDVRGVAREWSNSTDFAALLQAVDTAEGNLLRAVQCSLPMITTRDEALKVLARSATHAMVDFIRQQGQTDAFVQFWAQRWAPIGVANDPTALNKNWPMNVIQLWRA